MMNIQTSKCKVVNIYKDKYDIYIGRGRNSEWGNPFKVEDSSREECLEKYKAYITEKLERQPSLVNKLKTLKGKTLGCFCKPQRCHGDIIIEMIERYYPDE